MEKEENIKPLKFYDVEIWAAHKHSFLSAANATIRNIKYNSEHGIMGTGIPDGGLLRYRK